MSTAEINHGKVDAGILLDGLLPTNDVLATLCITRKTLSRYANDPRSGLPPSIKIGRTTYYSLRALNRWIRLRAGEDLDEFDHAA